MSSIIAGKKLADEVLSRIDYDAIIETARYFGTLNRQTGTPDAETAAAYIIDKMKVAGVEVGADTPTCLASIPDPTTLHVKALGESYEIECTTEVWSEDGADVEGEVVFDEASLREGELTLKEEYDRYEGLAGKVVITYAGNPTFFSKCRQIGVKGIICVRFREDAKSASLYGSTRVWGVPTLDTLPYFDQCPTIVLTRQEGDRIIELVKGGGKVEVSFKTAARNGLYTFTQPYACISGAESENYLLVCTHYDGWYRSVIDNALADGFMLELLRVLHDLQPKLKRGIKVVWLAGHENVPYAGSTYYVDKYFQDLADRCIAYVNIDVIGGKFPKENVWMNTTRMEGGFGDDIIEEVNGARPDGYIPMVRMADQSLWGVEVPLDLMINGGDPGWWYHSAEDTIDCMDRDILKRDIEFYVNLLMRIANSEHLPVDMNCFIGESRKYLHDLDASCGDDFDFAPAYQALDGIEAKVSALVAAMDAHPDRDRDVTYKKVAGELSRICYTGSDNYCQPLLPDRAMLQPTGGMTFVEGVTEDNAYPVEYLCVKTEFLRLRNRFVGELARLGERIDLLMGEWR